MVIYGEDTDWGRIFGVGIKKKFVESGWEVVSEDYVPLTQTDFYPILGKYKKIGASVLSGSSTSPPRLSAFVKQVPEVGVKAVVIADGLG